MTPFVGARLGRTFDIQPDGAAQIEAVLKDAASAEGLFFGRVAAVARRAGDNGRQGGRMGDKGGKKDKDKNKQQQVQKQKQEAQRKQDNKARPSHT